jgi:hypothetical protein
MIIVKGKIRYTSIDAAKRLGVSVNTIKGYINKGIIPKPPKVIQGCRIMNYFPLEYISVAKSHLENYRNTKSDLAGRRKSATGGG